MLTSIIFNEVTLGVGGTQYPSVFQLQPTTTSYALQAKVTYTSTDYSRSIPEVCYCTAIDDLPAEMDTVRKLRGSSAFITLKRDTAFLICYSFSPVLSPKGLNLYVWVNDVALASPATLTLRLAEFP